MNKINIVSMGPGHGDYILPVARETAEACDVIVGSERSLRGINTTGKVILNYTSDQEKLIKLLREFMDKRVAVLVSGDAGFYSFFAVLKREFGIENINIIPGISSAHYLLAKCGLTWDDTAFISLHGRDQDIIPIVEGHEKTVILTDSVNTPRKIAGALVNQLLGNMKMYIGSRLSCNDEKIVKDFVKNIACSEEEYDMCVVVVADE